MEAQEPCTGYPPPVQVKDPGVAERNSGRQPPSVSEITSSEFRHQAALLELT